MSARFLDEPARVAFAKAIKTIEEASAIEVVVAVRRSSAGYRHANAIVGVLAAFAGLAVMLFSEHEFGIPATLVDPFVLGLAAAGLVELLPTVKRLLTLPGALDREVHKAARSTFVERGVHNTRDRSGVLVYISWLEQRAAVVVDSGLARTLPADIVAALERALTAEVPKGGEAVAHQLARSLPQLAPAMPRRDDDENELADSIDSDLARGKK